MVPLYKQLTRSNILFPLALVLFEFSVYICNDMTQPAMLDVVKEFGVDNSWVPMSMTAFIFGGMLLAWLTGPLSDRIGRRPVLFAGVIYFILSCLAVYLVTTIEMFMVVRVLQGIGLCFINAVGYAAIQEAFDEKPAVKVIALMANVSLISPLIGPLSGAYMITFLPWRDCFVVVAIISFIALVALIVVMPETVDKTIKKEPLSHIRREFLELFRDKTFLISAVALPLVAIPLLGWIAISPVIIVDDLKLTNYDYAIMQIPVFLGCILGNWGVTYLTNYWPLARIVRSSILPCCLGLLVMLWGILYVSAPIYWLVAGMAINTFGQSLGFSILYRFALTSYTKVGKGTVAAGMSMLSMFGYALGIEVLRYTHQYWSILGFVLGSIAFFILYLPAFIFSVKTGESKRKRINEVLLEQ